MASALCYDIAASPRPPRILPVPRSYLSLIHLSLVLLAQGSVATEKSPSGTWRMLWTTEKEQLIYYKNAGLFVWHREGRRVTAD
jgi:hypothetical protein